MKIIMIGSVAAGTSAAAKARRNTEEAQITIYEKDSYISYSGCGLPYFVGGETSDVGKLTPRDALWFKERYNVEIKTGCEVLTVDPDHKTLKVKNLVTGKEFTDTYDKLVFATGSKPFKPQLDGITSKNLFTIKNPQNAVDVDTYIAERQAKKAVIIGGGYIGLEMAVALKERQMDVTILELSNHIMPPMDDEMAAILQKYITGKEINILTSAKITGFEQNSGVAQKVMVEGLEPVQADLFIWSAGIKPEVELAKAMGVKLGDTGAIQVDNRMQTNLPDVYAVGDCAQAYSLVTGIPLYRPMGSTANKMGRIAGDAITGGSLKFRGVLGTGIFKVFDLSVAMTGLTEKEARKLGYDIEVIHNIKPNVPEYYPGSTEMTVKAIADRKTEKLLGVQIVGGEGVDKRIDVFVTAITYGAKAGDLFHLDLAYAPPFATTKDPVLYTGMILDNALNRGRRIMTAHELIERTKSGEKITVIDVRGKNDRDKGFIEGSLHVPLQKIRSALVSFSKDDLIVVHCNKGVSGNAAQNILINNGFRNVYNLSGGYKQYKIEYSAP
ncbi:FAD-dependent oxidoreductase [Faecalispora anaeroviscerum]|uniref:FAD-dependent oxidoreductase n=1 Tax=Faecalispora anaeroviscerum TaxID=2991836 RepID=UPI0024BA88D2|nr:FAD-dependent oxidoreductase [Faecalispora anaeroviscerum]